MLELSTPYADVLMPLSTEEFAALQESILLEGVRDPVLHTEDGRVLDGHHRLQIDPNAPRRVVVGSTGWSDAVCQAYVISCNWQRRNLSPSQKAELRETMKGITWRLNQEGYTQQEIARMLRVPRETVRDWLLDLPPDEVGTNGGSAISSHPDEEAIVAGSDTDSSPFEYSNGEAVSPPPRVKRDGRVKLDRAQKAEACARVFAGESRRKVAADYGITHRALNKIIAANEVRRTRANRRAALAAEWAPSADDPIQSGDFEGVAAELPDESVSLIFTDPPYDRGALPLYARLAVVAKRVLRPGGSLLAYCGHYLLPDVLSLLSAELNYYWCCACVHTGTLARMNEYGVVVAWKPIVWFTNGPRSPEDKEAFVHDAVTSTQPGKEDHDWQQSEAEAVYYVEGLTKPGELVFDPFAGSGTTLVAAAGVGRQALGAEIDPQKCALANRKLKEFHADR